MSKLITIAVDAMGGDSSPKKIIDGIAHHFDKNRNSFYQIFGDKNQINKFIPRSLSNDCYEIIHTNEVVKGDDTPLGAAKRGKNTSMWLAVESVKVKKADIVISAGNTGALLVIAKLNLKMINNIDKPALSGLWPNKKGMSVVLDLGANIECNDKNLMDFSMMGSSLLKALFPDETAKVALLNIGSEEIKGNEIIKNTYQKLSQMNNLNYEFKGFIEGNNLMNGDVNVIVADGFTGNIVLKQAEGIYSIMKKRGLLDEYFTRFNYENYGGTPILGLNKTVIVGHGISNEIAIKNMITLTKNVVEAELTSKIKNHLN